VIGRFPFSSAKETDKDYKLIIEDKLDDYRKRMKRYCKDKLNMKISREF